VLSLRGVSVGTIRRRLFGDEVVPLLSSRFNISISHLSRASFLLSYFYRIRSKTLSFPRFQSKCRLLSTIAIVDLLVSKVLSSLPMLAITSTLLLRCYHTAICKEMQNWTVGEGSTTLAICLVAVE